MSTSSAWRLRAFALLSVACSASANDLDFTSTARRSAITRGESDPTDAAVVAILARDPDPQLACTGSLVHPRVVLTAAHCLAYLEETPLSVGFGPDSHSPELTIDVTDRALHPDYRPSPLALHDLAVLVLAEAAPVETLALGGLEASSSGSTARLVGFGVTEFGELGQKHEGTARIDLIDETRFTALPWPALTCSLDSGAPALLRRSDREELVGVTTSGDQQCAVFSRFTRVGPYLRSFILPLLDDVDAGMPLSTNRRVQPLGCQFTGGNGPSGSGGLVASMALGLVISTRKRREATLARASRWHAPCE